MEHEFPELLTVQLICLVIYNFELIIQLEEAFLDVYHPLAEFEMLFKPNDIEAIFTNPAHDVKLQIGHDFPDPSVDIIFDATGE